MNRMFEKNPEEEKQCLDFVHRTLLRSAPTDYYQSAAGQVLLENCFHIIVAVALAGNATQLVNSMGALECLYALVQHGPGPVQLRAVRCLQDLVALNPLNMAFLQHTGGVSAGRKDNLQVNCFQRAVVVAGGSVAGLAGGRGEAQQ